MPRPVQLQKAKMSVIDFVGGDNATVVVGSPSIEVQFNPESLKLTYSNSMTGGDQSGGSSMQFVGQSTTKLSFDLWFDVSAPQPQRAQDDGSPNDSTVNDVRKLTSYVVGFMKPSKKDVEQSQKDSNGNTKSETVKRSIAPAVRFEWGAFQFDGIVESLNATIDFFSAEGRALRSQLSVSMSQQNIPTDLLRGSDPGGDIPSPGINFQTPVKLGDTFQSLAGDLGAQDGWQDLAFINDIE